MDWARIVTLPLLLLPLIAAKVREPPGTWMRIRNVSDVHWEKKARFAVDEYNKNTKANVVFVRSLEGKEQLDSGIRDVFILEAKDSTGKIMKYEATVFEDKRPKGYMVLESFRPYYT